MKSRELHSKLTSVLIEALKEHQQNAALKAETTATAGAFEAHLRAPEASGGQARK